MIAFISGKISGDMDNYYDKFQRAEDKLKQLGYTVYNPAKLIDVPKHKRYFDKWNDTKPKKVWKYFMRYALRLLDKSDIVFFLPDWSTSEGAIVEFGRTIYSGKVWSFLEVF